MVYMFFVVNKYVCMSTDNGAAKEVHARVEVHGTEQLLSALLFLLMYTYSHTPLF